MAWRARFAYSLHLTSYSTVQYSTVQYLIILIYLLSNILYENEVSTAPEEACIVCMKVLINTTNTYCLYWCGGSEMTGVPTPTLRWDWCPYP